MPVKVNCVGSSTTTETGSSTNNPINNGRGALICWTRVDCSSKSIPNALWNRSNASVSSSMCTRPSTTVPPCAAMRASHRGHPTTRSNQSIPTRSSVGASVWANTMLFVWVANWRRSRAEGGDVDDMNGRMNASGIRISTWLASGPMRDGGWMGEIFVWDGGVGGVGDGGGWGWGGGVGGGSPCVSVVSRPKSGHN